MTGITRCGYTKLGLTRSAEILFSVCFWLWYWLRTQIENKTFETTYFRNVLK